MDIYFQERFLLRLFFFPLLLNFLEFFEEFLVFIIRI